MKKLYYLLIVSILFTPIQAFAKRKNKKGIPIQKYIQVGVGVGLSKSKFENYLMSVPTSPALGYNFSIAYNRRKKNWLSSIGIEYLSTAFRIDEIAFSDYSGKIIDLANFKYRFSHILLPIKIGYEFHVNKKFLISPYVGVAYGYNLGRVSKKYSKITGNESRKDSRSEFDASYNRLNMFGVFSAEMSYAINNRLNLCVAPSYYWMVSNMVEEGTNFYNRPQQYNNTMMVNFKITYQLK